MSKRLYDNTMRKERSSVQISKSRLLVSRQTWREVNAKRGELQGELADAKHENGELNLENAALCHQLMVGAFQPPKLSSERRGTREAQRIGELLGLVDDQRGVVQLEALRLRRGERRSRRGDANDRGEAHGRERSAARVRVPLVVAGARDRAVLLEIGSDWR